MGFRMKGTHKIVREITTDQEKLKKIAELLGADPEKLQAADIEFIYKEDTGQGGGAGNQGTGGQGAGNQGGGNQGGGT
jgi:hypothetical protein